MNRTLVAILGVTALVAGLGLREYLVREEISATQAQLRAQLTELINSASTQERINEVSSSSFVFEKFVSPVFEAANRLLLPSSRFQALIQWTQGLHHEISSGVEARHIAMKSQFEVEAKNIKDSTPPSVDRMIQLLKKSEQMNAGQKPSEIAVAEMTALKEAGQKRDDTTLSLVKEEGLRRLQKLRSMLKKANHKNMGDYLASGKFVKEIQTPAIELILQIRQEDIRKQAWSEFRTKLNEILTKRGIQISNAERIKKSKEIEKLFEEPMAQMFEQEDRPLNLIQPTTPPPSAAVIPREEDLYNIPEPSNPSDAGPISE